MLELHINMRSYAIQQQKKTYLGFTEVFCDNYLGFRSIDFKIKVLCEYLATKFRNEYSTAARGTRLPFVEKMDPIKSGAMWAESHVTQRQSRNISRHAADYFGSRMFASENSMKTLQVSNESAPRKYGRIKYTKIDCECKR